MEKIYIHTNKRFNIIQALIYVQLHDKKNHIIIVNINCQKKDGMDPTTFNDAKIITH